MSELQKTIEQMQRPHRLHNKIIRKFVRDAYLVECDHLLDILVLDLGQHHDVAPAHHHVRLEQDVHVLVVRELALDHVTQFVLVLLISVPLDVRRVLATQVDHLCH